MEGTIEWKYPLRDKGGGGIFWEKPYMKAGGFCYFRQRLYDIETFSIFAI